MLELYVAQINDKIQSSKSGPLNNCKGHTAGMLGWFIYFGASRASLCNQETSITK